MQLDKESGAGQRRRSERRGARKKRKGPVKTEHTAEGTAVGAAAVSALAGDHRPPIDQVAAFRPAILGIRAGTTAVSMVLASGMIADGDRTVIGWTLVILGYNVFRIARPVRYLDDTRSFLRVIGEVVIVLLAVLATDYWNSPFVFSLLTAIIVAGFARGFGFAVRIGAVSALAVAIPDLSRPGYDATDLRTSVQWIIELLLVGLVAGYARRVTGEADRQHSLALDRLGRLADANALLFSLHQVAQTLPASLDLDEVIDSTMARVKDLFRYNSMALLLVDETVGGWQVARWEGSKLPPQLADTDLPPPALAAMASREVVREDNLIRANGPGLAPSMRSGLYAVLTARESVVGLVVIEHDDASHFTEREVELLTGFVEPAALALDNARWFARLRTVGADEERTRIARDLHDRIGQSLAYLAFELDRIVKVDAKGNAVTSSLEQLRKDVRGVIGEVRDTLYDLRTDVSEHTDLPTVIDGFLKRVEERSGLQTGLEVVGAGRLPLLQEREMWRVAQEAITNVERHARATALIVGGTATARAPSSRCTTTARLRERPGGTTRLLRTAGHARAGRLHRCGPGHRQHARQGQHRAVRPAPGAAPSRGAEPAQRPFAAGAVDLRQDVRRTFDTTTAQGDPMTIRLMLADDHRMLREGLRRSMIDEGFDVVGEAGNGQEAITLAGELQPDVVLMDVTMPEVDGVEATRRIREQFPNIRVVMLTMHADEDVTVAAIRAGASGYLVKDCSTDEIADTVRQAANDEAALSKDLAASMLDEVRKLDNPAVAEADRVVTKREEAVLQLIADGCSTTEVAAQLYISHKTVKNHLASIYQKLDARDRTQAVLRAVRMGIVRLD